MHTYNYNNNNNKRDYPKSVGSSHANDDTINIAATKITANPVDVAIAAAILRCIRAKTDDIANTIIITPPAMTTPISACCANRLKPNERFLCVKR